MASVIRNELPVVCLLVACIYISQGYTQPAVTVRLRTRAVIPCKVQSQPYAVHWSKGSITTSHNDSIVFLYINNDVEQRNGEGYRNGRYDIKDDYSLVINNVTGDNSDLYFCEVTDKATTVVSRRSTNVTVYAPPLEPYPIIDECEKHNMDKKGTGQECSVEVTSINNITCSVDGYYPSLTLYFTRDSERVAASHISTKEWMNSDGTRGKMATLLLTDSQSSHGLFQCVAYGFGPAGKLTERTASIWLMEGRQRNIITTSQPVTDDESFGAFKYVPEIILLVIATVAISSGIFFCARNCRQGEKVDSDFEARESTVLTNIPENEAESTALTDTSENVVGHLGQLAYSYTRDRRGGKV